MGLYNEEIKKIITEIKARLFYFWLFLFMRENILGHRLLLLRVTSSHGRGPTNKLKKETCPGLFERWIC